MLRVKDLDFAYRLITVRGDRGGINRVTRLPEQLVQSQLGHVRALHQHDLATGDGETRRPDARAHKYPHAGCERG
jgi:hypothetical protein